MESLIENTQAHKHECNEIYLVCASFGCWPINHHIVWNTRRTGHQSKSLKWTRHTHGPFPSDLANSTVMYVLAIWLLDICEWTIITTNHAHFARMVMHTVTVWQIKGHNQAELPENWRRALRLAEHIDNNNLLCQLVNALCNPWRRLAMPHTTVASQFARLHCQWKKLPTQNKL